MIRRRKPADRCRPVTVEIDGEQVTMPVLSQEPMSEQARAAFAEVVKAVQLKMAAEPPDPNRCERCGFLKQSRLHLRRCEPTATETTT